MALVLRVGSVRFARGRVILKVHLHRSLKAAVARFEQKGCLRRVSTSSGHKTRYRVFFDIIGVH
jgi:hypothetical protein